MVSSSERRRLEAWYMGAPQPTARFEKCAAALALICGLVGLEPIFSTASELALEMPPLSVLCPTPDVAASSGAIGMCLAAAPRLGNLGKGHERQADVGSHQGKLQRVVE